MNKFFIVKKIFWTNKKFVFSALAADFIHTHKKT